MWPTTNEHTLVVPICMNSFIFVRQVLNSLFFFLSAPRVRNLKGFTDGLTLHALLEDSPLCIKGNTLQGETVSDSEAEKGKRK
jgi:hypothetical protein